MSKKQLRISDPVLVKQRINEFINRKINIVLKDNTVLFGELKKVEDEHVHVVNRRLKTVKFPLPSIVEFYVDINP